jgi:hypothetical protein
MPYAGDCAQGRLLFVDGYAHIVLVIIFSPFFNLEVLVVSGRDQSRECRINSQNWSRRF